MHVLLSPSSIICYWPMGGDALRLQAWWKVVAAYRQVDGLVICGLTACTLGSAPGPMLVYEYGRTLPFLQS